VKCEINLDFTSESIININMYKYSININISINKSSININVRKYVFLIINFYTRARGKNFFFEGSKNLAVYTNLKIFLLQQTDLSVCFSTYYRIYTSP